MRVSLLACLGCLVLGLSISGCTIEPLASDTTVTPAASEQETAPLHSLLPTLAVTPIVPTLPTVSTPTAHVYLPADADNIFLVDDFSSSQAAWQWESGLPSAIKLAEGRMVMTARTPYTTLESRLTAAIPNDFYAEITTRTALCGTDNDSFGLVFRRGESEEYRMVVTCGGLMRFEHMKGNALSGANQWSKASGLLAGAPAENRIGVLVQGMRFQFFANGVSCFVYSDPILDSGKLGVFIRTEKSQLLTVSFDDLSVYRLKAKPK
jgi:hypothetical protein